MKRPLMVAVARDDVVPHRNAATPFLHHEMWLPQAQLRLHFVASSHLDCNNRPVLICLHDWAECWYRFFHHDFVARHADACQVIAPDLRGTNLTTASTPHDNGRSHHDLTTLSSDMIEFIQLVLWQLPHNTPTTSATVTLLGQGWGAAIAYAVATRAPHLVARLVLLSPPTLPAEDWPLLQHLVAASYCRCWAVPMLRWRKHYLLRRYMAKNRHGHEHDNVQLLPAYQTAWQQPGMLRCLVAQVRQLPQSKAQWKALPPLTVPVLLMEAEEGTSSSSLLPVQPVDNKLVSRLHHPHDMKVLWPNASHGVVVAAAAAAPGEQTHPCQATESSSVNLCGQCSTDQEDGTALATLAKNDSTASSNTTSTATTTTVPGVDVVALPATSSYDAKTSFIVGTPEAAAPSIITNAPFRPFPTARCGELA